MGCTAVRLSAVHVNYIRISKKDGSCMLKSEARNMTEGRPLVLLILFALPLLAGNLFQQAYNLADSMIVGRFLGSGALAAVGATASVTFLFFSVCHGISSGGGIITSQYFGAGDTENVRKAIANSAYITIIASLIMGTIAFLLSPVVLRLMRTPEDILPAAVTYMRMMCAGVPLVGVYNYISSMLRALGDSRTPLLFLIISCILNVCLDLLCVAVFGMGVFGAALATLVSQFIAGISCLIFAFRTNELFRLTRTHLIPDPVLIRSAVRLGVPLALQWSMIAVSTTALQTVVNSFGTGTVAAFTATSRIEQLIHQPFGSLGLAFATYAGQNIGAGKYDRIKQGITDGLWLVLVFSGAMMLLMHLFGAHIISGFVSNAEVIRLGDSALKITSCFYFFLGIIYVIRGALNGAGDALFSLINGTIEMTCRIGLPVLLISCTSLGVWSIWWTAGLTWLISAGFCSLRYLSWRRKQSSGIRRGTYRRIFGTGG